VWLEIFRSRRKQKKKKKKKKKKTAGFVSKNAQQLYGAEWD
jgi:hypothetical protein